ncbi:hypothetical protein GCM10018780_72850 [Streptomyces lanatus]|nr:hypothetical protein GCM10018780_72850 [Streptomyces lanatus]
MEEAGADAVAEAADTGQLSSPSRGNRIHEERGRCLGPAPLSYIEYVPRRTPRTHRRTPELNS